MRVLLVHNYYGSEAPSGENEVVRDEVNSLRARGHQVETLTRSSDEIRGRGLAGALRGALAVPWNPFEARRMAERSRAFRPDVVHAHNTFPLISPAIFQAVSPGAARVLTLHNYRLVCAKAIPQRDGIPCTECLDQRSVVPALKHGCYRDSRLATLPLAAGIALHRSLGTWRREVDAFITLTPFQRELMAATGLQPEKLYVKPNFYPGEPAVLPWEQRAARCVFVGRLSPEKGLATLLDAWRAWGAAAPELFVIGDGPQRSALENRAVGLPIVFTGQLSAEQAQREIAQARLLLLPSIWFEGFPMVLREALAFGTPAAVSRIGPLPSLVGNGECGLIFEPGNPASLLSVVRDAWSKPAWLAVLGAAAHEVFRHLYTADAHHVQLMQIYEAARARRVAHDSI